MLTRKERTGDTWVGLLILVLGVAIGILVRPSHWRAVSRATTEPAAPPPLAAELQPAASKETPPDNGLVTIELVIPASSAAELEAVRDAALERGIIEQGEERKMVEAEVRVQGRTHPAKLRIKGDWTDHVEGRQWSYRIKLDETTFLGMREFSIQAPRTRGYLWEWLVHEAARRENVLVPRSTFVNVVQNGHALGVYFLEEHFEKELLESQGRREGPIVVWDESTLWSTLLLEGFVPQRGVRAFQSAVGQPAHDLAAAETRAYGEKGLSRVGDQNRALFAAIDQMKGLRALALQKESAVERLRVEQSMQDLRGRTLEELVDVDALARAHALASVFQLEHSLAWHNMRFHRDPVLGLLEPILFDNAAQSPGARDPVPFRADGLLAAFAASPRYYDGLFAHLGRMLRSDWLDAFFTSIGPDLARFEVALQAEEPLPAGFAANEMKQRLRGEAVYLRKACLPTDPINFEAAYQLAGAGEDPGSGTLEVWAWATTRSPVAVERFVFSNGSSSLAAEWIVPDSIGAELWRDPARADAPPVVVLPNDGRPVGFRFPMNARLANLETVDKVTRAVRDELRSDTQLDLDVRARFRLLAAEESSEEKLTFRKRPGVAPVERPPAPELAQVLERHPFLHHDAARNELSASPGEWDVDGDLVLPTGIGLAIGPGTTLRFAEGALLLSDAPLRFEGRPDAPIVLEPAAGAATWQGVAVLGAAGRSRWAGVTVRATSGVARGSWTPGGGVAFYRAPLTMAGCRFEAPRAESALAVFDADLSIDGTTFTGCAARGLVARFATGTVQGCTFEDGAGDGLVLTGSDVTVRNTRFQRLAGEACAIGEGSHARVDGGLAEDVTTAVAARDGSTAEVAGLVIRGARGYALAALVEKPELGPARLSARGLTIERSGKGDVFAQTGCTLELDGVTAPTRDGNPSDSSEEDALGRGD